MKNTIIINSLILLCELEILIEKTTNLKDLEKFSNIEKSLKAYIDNVKYKYEEKHKEKYEKSLDVFYNILIDVVTKSLYDDLVEKSKKTPNNADIEFFLNKLYKGSKDLSTINKARLVLLQK